MEGHLACADLLLIHRLYVYSRYTQTPGADSTQGTGTGTSDKCSSTGSHPGTHIAGDLGPVLAELDTPNLDLATQAPPESPGQPGQWFFPAQGLGPFIVKAGMVFSAYKPSLPSLAVPGGPLPEGIVQSLWPWTGPLPSLGVFFFFFFDS
jgi:hypothetical protein